MNNQLLQKAISDLHRLVTTFERNGQCVRRFTVVPEIPSADTISRAKVSSIVFKSDVYIEFGGPNEVSSTFVIAVENSQAVIDGEIILIGDELPEMSPGIKPFALVILASGLAWDRDIFYQILKYKIPPGVIDGLMIKNTIEKSWYRLSQVVVEKKLSFVEMGKSILDIFKYENPSVVSASVLFVTSSAKDVQEFISIENAVKDIRQKLKSEIWLNRGVDITACIPGGHCGSCKDDNICKEIRKMKNAYDKNSKRVENNGLA